MERQDVEFAAEGGVTLRGWLSSRRPGAAPGHHDIRSVSLGVRHQLSRRTRRLVRWRPSAYARIGIITVLLLAAVGAGLFVFLANRDVRPAIVIAHRGSSATAPENTLAAFRLAADQHADFVELDVQESSDGQVLVVHDSDLMKVGGNPARIWDSDAATLRAVDVGSFRDRRYSAERLPLLAEALAECRGRCRVIVELKSYGHDQQLESARRSPSSKKPAWWTIASSCRSTSTWCAG